MASLDVLKIVLILRVLTLLTLLASVLVMGLNNFNDSLEGKIFFVDLIAYRYVFACGAAGFLYTLVQIPFAMYNIAKGKRWIRNGCLQEFDFYGDKLIALLLATGVGVGFGVTFYLKWRFNMLSDSGNKFLNLGYVSSGLLLAACLLMTMLSVFSSNRH